MVNGSHFTSVILSGYIDVGQMRYFYFSVFTFLYLIIVFANVLLIGVICVERTLHEPMYLFLCSLSVNELYGSTGLFPALLVNMLSDTHEVPLSFCYLQIFCLYSYAMVEFNNLAVMSYDRFVSICYPFRYNYIMTSNHILMLIVTVWLYSFIQFSTVVSLTLRLELCGNVIDKVWCDNYLLAKLACSPSTVNNIYGLYITVLSIIIPLSLISFSYLKILKICWNATTERKQKALGTCAPQILSLLNFSLACFFEVTQSRFSNIGLPAMLRIFISVYFLMCQPLLNPLLYGLGLNKVRKAWKKILHLMS